MSRHLLTIDGHAVAAEMHLTGDSRPPVVFFHGIMTSIDLAPEIFLDAQAESWIAISLPGHHPGTLPEGCRPHAIDAALFAHLHESALTQLVGTRPVIAAGWSAGGFAALNLASRHPRRVTAVASLAGFARGTSITGLLRWLMWLARRPVGRAATTAGMRVAAAWPAAYRGLLGLLAADGVAAAWISRESVARMHAAFARHDMATLTTMLAALDRLEITDQLASIRVPAWIAGGGADDVVPRAETERIAKAIPGAVLRVYDQAGHLFFSEWPRVREEFAAWRQGLSPLPPQETAHTPKTAHTP